MQTTARPSRVLGVLGVLGVTALTLILIAALTALGLFAALSPAGAQERGKDPDFNLPAVGVCRDYTAKQVAKATNDSPAVACDGLHTAQTIGVFRLKGGTKAAFGPASLNAAYTKCLKALGSTVGSALPRTAYSIAYFSPTKAERRQGAKWVRCDLTLLGGKALAPIPTVPVSSPITDAIGACAVTVRGRTVPTVCALKHDYRAAAAYTFPGKKFPGSQKVLRSVIITCAKKVSTPTKFWAFYPDAYEWKAGLRQVTCLSRTKS